jgi:hypothetical protein
MKDHIKDAIGLFLWTFFGMFGGVLGIAGAVGVIYLVAKAVEP